MVCINLSPIIFFFTKHALKGYFFLEVYRVNADFLGIRKHEESNREGLIYQFICKWKRDQKKGQQK